jgi:hypothetical protein
MNRLIELEGKSLDAVSFQDSHVTFQFEGLTLAALASPVLINSTINQDTYTGGFVKQVGQKVTCTTETDENLEISFGNNTKILIPLNVLHPPGHEMAILSRKGQVITGWCRSSNAH